MADLFSPHRPTTLPRARGALDVFDSADDGSTTLGGWLAHPDFSLTDATVYVDDTPVGSCALARREDLVGIWPHVPTTHVSGYTVRGTLPASPAPIRTVTVEGSANGKPQVCFRTQRRVQSIALTTPDADLLMRVSGNRDPGAFAQIGLDAALDLLRAIDQHRGLQRVHRILDWGCGPGRISVQIADLCPQIAIAGADLDAEAIAWCNQHLRAGAFHATKPYPPLPFPDQSFDAVVAVSVMTHLDWPVQRQWLREMRRVLRPGGVFAASVHGPFAAAFSPGARDRVLSRGFTADLRDKSLDGIAPRGYYRSAFQTPEYTRERWAEEVEVVDYIPAGLAGYQDLVVTRRPL